MDDQQTLPGVSPRPGAPPPGGPPPGAPLRRSRRSTLLGGVCGGLGRYCDLDPVVFRVVFAVLALTGGLGLIAYGFAWLLIPLDGEEENEGRRLLSGRVEGPALTALLCALVGCGLLLSMLRNGSVLGFSAALSTVVAGAAVWSRHRRLDGREGAADPTAAQAAAGGAARAAGRGGAPPETQAPPRPGGPSWWRDPVVKDTADAGYLWGPDEGPYDSAEAVTTRCRRTSRAGHPIGGWTFLLALPAGAGGAYASWDTYRLGTSLQIGLACALAVFGLGLLVSAWFGRTGGGTVLAALLTGGLLAGAAVLPESATADWTVRQWRPETAAAVREDYEVGTGVGRLDLGGLRLAEGQTVRTNVRVGVGKIRVGVPEGVEVRLTAHVGIGDVRLPGETDEDVDVRPGLHEESTLPPADGRAARGVLELELTAGAGQVEVARVAP